MKNTILLFLMCMTASTVAQTEEEMLNAGLKPGVVKTIKKKFDGSLSAAINQWSDSGNGKLSKKLVESCIELGFNEVWLKQKLEVARNQRALIAGAILVGIGAGMSAAYGGGGYDGTYGNYYQKQEYDVSNSDLTYELPTIQLPSNYYSITNYSLPSTSQIIESPSANYSYETPFMSSITDVNSSSQAVTPLIYGSSSTYISGKNSINTGYDEAGVLNLYDSSGMTIGAIREDESGYALYNNGKVASYTTKPNNEGVSTVYVSGIAVGAQKYDSEGNITLFDSSGNVTGYSKKVKGGYENYDQSGRISSFTSLEDKDYNPLDGIRIRD